MPHTHPPHESSLSESTISQVVPTESAELPLPPAEQPPQPAPNSQKKKITLERVVKFLFTIGIVVAALYFIWQSPEEAASAVATRAYHEGTIELNQTTGKKFAWLRQRVDHFSPTDERTFYQRMFFSNEGSSLRNAQPVFLFIPGLHPVTSLQDSKLLEKQAKERKGISLAIEMRYFGESRPFGDDSYSLEGLKYLSMEQMVEDIAYAIQRIVDNRFFGITERNQWIISGANEAGTLAAWVRAKYPSLSAGAIASSPYLPTVLVPLFNERVYAKVESGGKKCHLIVSKMRQNLEAQLADDRKPALVYQIGQGVELTPDEVLYFYQRRIDVILREAYVYVCYQAPETTLLETFSSIMLTQEAMSYEPLGLSQRVMASQDDWLYFEAVRTARANWYLRCSQTGFFDISTNRSFSSPRINEGFFRERCKFIFGAALWPDPKPLLDMYKPYLATASNLLITHGYYGTSPPI